MVVLLCAGDACDNCVFNFNSTQSDSDQDNQGDLCDLNDGVIYLFTGDPNYMEWQVEDGFTSWNSYKGDLAVLKSTGTYTQAPGSNSLARRDCDLTNPWAEDFDIPSPGQAAFFLTTGVAGGVESSLGTNSAGTPRPNTNSCP